MVEIEVAALIAPWLTPTSLFVVLNIVLATIFFANNKHHSKNNHENSNNNHDNDNFNQFDDYQNQLRGDYEGASLVPPPPQLVRAPSLFSRVASFNFSNFYSESQPPSSEEEADRNVTVARAPSLLYRVTSFNFGRGTQKADGERRREEEAARDVSVSHARRENQQQQQQEEEEVAEVEEEKVVKVKKRGSNKKMKKEAADAVKETPLTTATAVKKTPTPTVTVTATGTTPTARRVDEGVDSKADDFIQKFKQQLKLQRLESLLCYRS
ncbi:hypothetical protein SOVF_195100 [Spinacia oleracea]|nr:hypothetical protein SOVF_195100 [Spinacia oleracea]